MIQPDVASGSVSRKDTTQKKFTIGKPGNQDSSIESGDELESGSGRSSEETSCNCCSFDEENLASWLIKQLMSGPHPARKNSVKFALLLCTECFILTSFLIFTVFHNRFFLFTS